jgi:translation elongation factor EF-4
MKESSEGSIKIQSVSTHIYRSHSITAHIGDTLHRIGEPVDPIPGFKPAKAMVGVGIIINGVFSKRLLCLQVYAGVFPVDTNDFLKLEESIKRVCNPFYPGGDH